MTAGWTPDALARRIEVYFRGIPGFVGASAHEGLFPFGIGDKPERGMIAVVFMEGVDNDRVLRFFDTELCDLESSLRLRARYLLKKIGTPEALARVDEILSRTGAFARDRA